MAMRGWKSVSYATDSLCLLSLWPKDKANKSCSMDNPFASYNVYFLSACIWNGKSLWTAENNFLVKSNVCRQRKIMMYLWTELKDDARGDVSVWRKFMVMESKFRKKCEKIGLPKIQSDMETSDFHKISFARIKILLVFRNYIPISGWWSLIKSFHVFFVVISE